MALASLAVSSIGVVLADSTTSDIAILSAVSMAGGYVLLAGLWYFVFRDKDREKRKP